MGSLPTTDLHAINANGEIISSLYLLENFTDLWGNGKLWHWQAPAGEPVLLQICKHSGADTGLFEQLFYLEETAYSGFNFDSLCQKGLSANRVLGLFHKMDIWLKNDSDILKEMKAKLEKELPGRIKEYFEGGGLEQDVQKLVKWLGEAGPDTVIVRELVV